MTSTETVLTFLLRDDKKLQYAIHLSILDLGMLKRWLHKEAEISEDSPVLAKALLHGCLEDVNWEVVLKFLEIKKELLSGTEV